jgi:hypothetical protein
MAEARQYIFSHKEVAEALVKQQGIHEGLWGIYIEFGIGAANIGATPEGDNVVPAAIVPIQKMGIQRFDEPSNLTVDAAEVNPASKTDAKSTSSE